MTPYCTIINNGCVSVSVAGIPNQTFSLEATTNLAAPVWVTLCTTNFGTNTLMTIIDNDVTNYPARFYRTRLQ